MKHLISHLLFPLTFFSGLWLALEGLERGVDDGHLLLGISVGTCGGNQRVEFRQHILRALLLRHRDTPREDI